MAETGDLRTLFNERELDILRRIAQGDSNREIAEQLFISVNTVRWYNKQIYDKLDTHSRTTAIARARELGLIEGSDTTRELDEVLNTPSLTNLPSQLTPFIGREHEIRELRQLFYQPGVRLLTILGPGGIGKTRLAQQLAGGCLDAFEDGVFWVALAPVTAAAADAQMAVLTILANTLHITLTATTEPETQIIDYLRSRQMLLAIDNFEHLLGGATLVSHLLEAAPGVKILTTSREALGIYGEAVYRLTGMAVPGDEALSHAQDFDAVKLFLQTMRRVGSEFDTDDDTLNEITNICRLVEGLPLGIELGASWIRSLSLTEIREQLEQGLDILETRTHNIRHVFDRSWQLLSEPEQIAFARMSVFRGGCTREAIQDVTGASLRMVASLVDKSLVWHLPDGHYAMHELLRQYATEQLQRLPDEDALLERHCDYYAAYAGHWGRGLHNQQQIEGLAALEQAYENIHAAWQYAAQHGREKALRELLDMWYFFDIRSRWREGNELFGLAAARVDGLTHARLMARQAVFTFRLGAVEKTRSLITQSLPLFHKTGEEAEIAHVTQTLGNLHFFQGDLETSARYWLEAIDIGERCRERFVVVSTLVNMGVSHENHGNFGAARAEFQRALELSREIGDFMTTALALINLGELAATEGDLDTAATYYRSALGTANRIGQRYLIAGALGELGHIALRQGRLSEAKRFTEQSLRIHLEHDNRRFAIRSLAYLAAIACGQDDYETARAHFLRAFTFTCEVRAFGAAVRPLLYLADCFVKHGNHLQAVEICTAVAQYSGSGLEHREAAEQRCATFATFLEPDVLDAAVRRGKEIDLETMLMALITELEVP